MRVDELATKIEAEVVGDGGIEITGVGTLELATAGQVSFLSNPRYTRLLASTRASAVIVGPADQCDRVTLLRSSDPYYSFRQAVVLLHGHRQHTHTGVHPAAHVDPTARIGQGTIVYPNAYIGPRAQVGSDCIVYPNVTIYDDCVLGDRVIIHGGATIGADGYGYAFHAGVHHKIPQVGNVVLEDDVEIGANCVIARAAMGSTLIGKGTKLDAQVMVGHGVKIGPHSLLVAQVAVGGSTTIGHHATIAGQSGIAGHLKIGSAVTMAGGTGVTGDVEDKAVLMGVPAMPIGHARRVWIATTRLPELMDRVRVLEKRLEKLQGTVGGDT